MSSLHKGINLALLTAFISGFANFINKYGLELWDNSSVYTTAKNIVAAVLLTVTVLAVRNFPEIRRLTRKQRAQLVAIGFIGGSIPFLLFFRALTIIPALEASFIHKTLFIWVALLAYPFLKERLSLMQLAALGLLLLSVYLGGAPQTFTFGAGSLLALGATLLWAVENVFAKRILQDVSAAVVGWARMFFGSLFLLAYLAVTGNITQLIPATLPQAGITLGVGVILFGYVISWYAALKHAPATVVSSVLVLATPITALLNGLFIQHAFPAPILLSLAVMIGALLILLERPQGLFLKRQTTPSHNT
ncbi:MAG: hypothetical protein COT39_03785 [Parcubacteria group bacterium CG08_land_8_20_14_0_20_48_21]|nr:MAG: hypothetical protein AUK21_02400 [Parcubacteria group bacterium CG2_30_48_51]PIS32582.1 MAG: hypothetical protein COT39_03785 [Parcubacteria group bacterium CG08_land_8_20_14_0_20_48_21]PIW78822.1 MAG: hypothetical protein COZ99_04260 [Parcubacteria group bacterium CG_4_8_14_3_um_filter_48_16]PIY77995.1 MAG: hypothetical protein COY83_02140 [Parcubacteria group bacterium CG_4_10_14_0_8_um_filter_48_154]PIZ77112.1 MAG: hypothetical protein COY03_03870 [bacterium CG_4_10_14_0_2_um_filter_